MGKKKFKTTILENEIVRVLEQAEGKKMNPKQIYAQVPLEIRPENPKDLNPILINLAEEGRLEQGDAYKFFVRRKPELITGSIDITRNGRIFLVPEDGDTDFPVAEADIPLLQFDKVEAILFRTGKKKTHVVVRKLIAHSNRRFTGVLLKRHNVWFIQPDLPKMQVLFKVKHAEDLKTGYKVSFVIENYKKVAEYPQAKIQEVLGLPGQHLTEMHAILEEFGLPEAFDEAVMNESEAISSQLSKEDFKGREDFRKVTTFTIDPDTAKDFDDAISFSELKDGSVEVGVHIADVSHYVRPDTYVDKEAIKRATSVYLVDRVVPMLPNKLSDDICSLVEGKDRLTFSVIFTLDKQFKILKHRFAKTVIHSDKRFSYEEAQEILNKKQGLYHDELKFLLDFSKQLNAVRMKKGAMNFESPEYRFQLDDQFRPVSMQLKVRQDTNKMIEELMLLANRTVAEFVYKQKPVKPFVYRTHDQPTDVKLAELSRFLKRLGYSIQIDTPDVFRTSLNQVIEESEGKPEQDLIRQMSIRSMAKAVYTPNKPDHFGLAFPYYTHFTSPIRRYPDLIVHRLLFTYMNGGSMQKDLGWNMTQLDAACKHSSAREVVAADAERASVKYKQAEWMEMHLGEVFDGVVSGLTDFGIFVEIKPFRCEGMIRLNTIRSDRFEYDEVHMAVIGMRTYRKIKMGDTLKIMVAGADKIRRTIDLELVEDKPQRRNAGRSKKRYR